MERAQARKLQPHYIGSFFATAFDNFGGNLLSASRTGSKFATFRPTSASGIECSECGHRAQAYERITFQKEAIRLEGKPPAALVAPGHPLLEATIDLTLERYTRLPPGAVFIDPLDQGTEPRVLLYLEHSLSDAALDAGGNPRVISRRLLFVEMRRSSSEMDSRLCTLSRLRASDRGPDCPTARAA